MTDEIADAVVSTVVAAADVVEPVAQTETPKPKPEKVVHYKIFVDDNDNPVWCEVLGRGRPPRGSTKNEHGDIVCPAIPILASTAPKVDSDYITLDPEGKVVSREKRGITRGRPKTGFAKQVDGEYAGHFVKRLTDEKPEVKPLTQPAPPVVDATDVVQDALNDADDLDGIPELDDIEIPEDATVDGVEVEVG